MLCASVFSLKFVLTIHMFQVADKDVEVFGFEYCERLEKGAFKTLHQAQVQAEHGGTAESLQGQTDALRGLSPLVGDAGEFAGVAPIAAALPRPSFDATGSGARPDDAHRSSAPPGGEPSATGVGANIDEGGAGGLGTSASAECSPALATGGAQGAASQGPTVENTTPISPISYSELDVMFHPLQAAESPGGKQCDHHGADVFGAGFLLQDASSSSPAVGKEVRGPTAGSIVLDSSQEAAARYVERGMEEHRQALAQGAGSVIQPPQKRKRKRLSLERARQLIIDRIPLHKNEIRDLRDDAAKFYMRDMHLSTPGTVSKDEKLVALERYFELQGITVYTPSGTFTRQYRPRVGCLTEGEKSVI